MWTKPKQVLSEKLHEPEAQPIEPAAIKRKNPGRRYAQIVKLKPEHAAKYKEVRKCAGFTYKSHILSNTGLL